ncbi:MAG: FAD-dependent oxidoreductase, partial [Proteobacteria bacterium]|nr:FAD-dependent oxidoreductase [Pseudomonadota bacterium]
MKIIVLGGGVIGVTTAYYLTEADHEVTLVERRQGETSFANGGQISAGHAAPWASPQVPRNLLKWLGTVPNISRSAIPISLTASATASVWWKSSMGSSQT